MTAKHSKGVAIRDAHEPAARTTLIRVVNPAGVVMNLPPAKADAFGLLPATTDRPL